jgi:arylsulfatase A-like enzyme
MPAFGSIFTGLQPNDHGAVSFSGYLAEQNTTLAELLRDAGYSTLGVVSHVFVDRSHGFEQGFETYDESNVLDFWEITSGGVTDSAMALLEDTPDKPFFLFAHYFDPHYDFRDHGEWDFADDYDGWLDNEQRHLVNLRMKRHLLRESDVEHLKDLYDEEIAYTDRQIGRLVTFLHSQPFADDTAIVVVSDHGEEFMERGWIGHTISLNREVIRVPLLIHLPGITTSRINVSEPVETRALFQTFLDYLGVVGTGGAVKPSLLKLLTEPSESEPHSDLNPVFSSVWLPDAPIPSGKRSIQSMVRLGDWKLIVDATHQRTFLYNLAEDPEEQVNLAGSEKHRYLELLQLLNTFEDSGSGRPSLPTKELTEEEIKKLKSLGYL